MRITIKRRLLISNILMLGILAALIIAIFLGISYVLFGIAPINNLGGVFPVPLEQGYARSIDFSEIDIHSQDNILAYRLGSGQYILVLPEDMSQRFESIEQTESTLFVDILLMHEAMARMVGFNAEHQIVMSFAMLLGLFIFVIAINSFLTKFAFNPIMTSLDVLATGVQEISEGNLDCRIVENMGNEFDPVCANFNEMAKRLSEMVEQRQIDEKNRKELIAGISHDLRTPLTSIKTYVEGIELGMATTPQKKEKFLSIIKEKAKDIEHILNQLFLFSRLDIGEFPLRIEQVDAGNWIVNFIDNISEEYAKIGLRVELDVNFQNTLFAVDSVQLKNVLINILENSAKYGNNDNGMMHVICTKEDESIVITMTDNGPGVTQESLGKLFDIFYRADKARSNTSQGSGLGLAISAKIIEKMSGTIDATNAVGGGLSITIRLPLRKNEHL